MELLLVSPSPALTREIGRRVGQALPDPALIFLEGDLGAGKTLFTRGVYEGIGGTDPAEVVSPSYALVNVYEGSPRPFHHVDFYRLEHAHDLAGIEYEDFLWHETGVTVVEWPRRAVDLVRAEDYLMCRLSAGETEGARTLRFSASGTRYLDVFERLR